MIIYCAFVISAGWIGLLVSMLTGSSASSGLGLLVFIAIPVIMVFVLRDPQQRGLASGMNPHLISRGGWYAMALLFPAVYTVIYALGRITGVFTADTMKDLVNVNFFALVLPIAGPSFVKNICEEFGFRGYLVPAVFRDERGILPHAAVGAVWALWHIPYWLFLIPRDVIASVHADGIVIFVLISLVSVFLMSIVYNEIRLITGSMWPAVVLHTSANTASMLFLTHVKYAPGTQWLIGVDGLVSSLIVCGVGVLMYRFRIRHAVHTGKL